MVNHCLSGGSHSDNKASLSSSETVLELPTGTELGKNYIQNKFLDLVGPYPPDMEIVVDPRNRVPSRILAWQ